MSYSSSDSNHGDHTYHYISQSCPNEWEPAWFTWWHSGGSGTSQSSSGTAPSKEVTGGIVSNILGPNQGAYDLVTSDRKSSGDSNADKDIIDSSLAGAFGTMWISGNGAMFVKASGFDYSNASQEAAQNAYSEETASSMVLNITTGDIIIIKLRGGSQYAVIKITSVDPSAGGGANTGEIGFDYKI